MKICKFLKNVNDILKPHDTKSEWIPNKATINRAISNATQFSIHLECFSVTSNLYGLCKSLVLISGSAAELVEVLSSLEMWSLCLCCSQLAVDVVPMMLNKSVSLFLVLWLSLTHCIGHHLTPWCHQMSLPGHQSPDQATVPFYRVLNYTMKRHAWKENSLFLLTCWWQL